MTKIPVDPDAKLTRACTAAALTEVGYPTAPATLASLACRGGGPEFQKFGHRPLYTWSAALEWAEKRLSKPIRSTSELFSIKKPPAAALPRPHARKPVDTT